MAKNYFHGTCRFCGKSEGDYTKLVKYGVRHYAHHSCYLDHKPLRELQAWQVNQFPFKVLRERGLMAEAEACAARVAAVV